MSVWPSRSRQDFELPRRNRANESGQIQLRTLLPPPGATPLERRVARWATARVGGVGLITILCWHSCRRRVTPGSLQAPLCMQLPG